MPRRPSSTPSNPRSWRSSGRAAEATVRDVQEALNARGGKVRAYTTLLTVMTRLDGKGLLVRRRAGRLDVYAPALVARRLPAGARRGRGRGAGRGLRRPRARPFRAPHRRGSTRSGWRSSAGWRTVTESRLRRAEFAVAAFGLTAFLLALVFALDAVRFHGDVLVAALEGAAARRGARARHAPDRARAVRPVRADPRAALDLARRLRAPPDRGADAGARGARDRGPAGRGRRRRAPLAFCAGLLRPRVYVSEGALRALGDDELAAVVAHESHHAARRDPLRILVARAIGDAYSLGALPRREQALAELAADAAAVRSGGRRAARGGAARVPRRRAGIAPERVDRLAGAPPQRRGPARARGRRRRVIGALVVLLALGRAGARAPARSACRSPPRRSGSLCALTARFAAMGPAWLGWRRAGAFLA